MIRFPSNVGNPFGMPCQGSGAGSFSCLGVPESYRLVHASSGQTLTIGRPSHTQNPVCVTRQGKLWRSGLRIPYPSCLIARACSQSTATCGTELSGQYRFSMPRYSMRHARDCLDFENSLRFGAQRYCCFKGVLDAMAAQKLEQVGRILVNNDVCLWNMYSKAIRQKLFSFLIIQFVSQTKSPL